MSSQPSDWLPIVKTMNALLEPGKSGALRLRDSEIRQYRQIWAHGAWRSENLRPLPTIFLGILNSSEP